MSNAKTLVDSKIAGKKVVVFSKTYCPYCVEAKKLLATYNLSSDDLEIIELDKAPYSSDMDAIQNYLQQVTGARSVSYFNSSIRTYWCCDNKILLCSVSMSYM